MTSVPCTSFAVVDVAEAGANPAWFATFKMVDRNDGDMAELRMSRWFEDKVL